MVGPGGCSGPTGSSIMMPFIISSNNGKNDRATRKLVRSHVMRGKRNRGPGKARQRTGQANTVIAARAERLKLEEVVHTFMPFLPSRIGTELYFDYFSNEIEPQMLLNMAKVSAVAQKIVFPLTAVIPLQRGDQEWSYPLGLDPLALHITACATDMFVDKVLRRQDIRPAAILHLQRGLKLLRERLLGDDNDIKISDSTMTAVLKLANVSHFSGDLETATHHMEGLRRMVELRGGLDVFKDENLLFEILRCDLKMGLLSGTPPLFFYQDSNSMAPYPAKLLTPSRDGQDDGGLPRHIDDGLATAWRVMKKFCFLVDLGAETQRSMSLTVVRETMTAVSYRLLNVRFATGSIAEAVRHGLLALSYHVFMQWHDIWPPYPQFATAYKSCILGLESPDGSFSSRLILWLLMIGANSVFNARCEAWLRDHFREHADRCRVSTWRDMQRLLKSFMWISVMDEQSGRDIYDSLCSRGHDT
ncbi:hypothetical protein GQ53DRAFT_6281 [Thozetella sp. PMI_491]|nr:hypothetical protein GQ53DRAFT_6281 [Thozetella sp. PMI_491]